MESWCGWGGGRCGWFVLERLEGVITRGPQTIEQRGVNAVLVLINGPPRDSVRECPCSSPIVPLALVSRTFLPFVSCHCGGERGRLSPTVQTCKAGVLEITRGQIPQHEVVHIGALLHHICFSAPKRCYISQHSLINILPSYLQIYLSDRDSCGHYVDT